LAVPRIKKREKGVTSISKKSRFILLASKKSSRRQKTYEIAILNFLKGVFWAVKLGIA
jgi:hypothetical protein